MIGNEINVSNFQGAYKHKSSDNFINVNIFDEARVEEVIDDETMKIKVSIPQKGGSNTYYVDCYPLLPMMLYVKPKKGELVKILIVNNELEPHSPDNAYWVGPTILQLQNIFQEKYIGKKYKPSALLSKKPEAKGLIPDDDDVGLIGRDNTDVLLKRKEVIIRAGKHPVNDNTVLNNNNPAYIQLKINSKGNRSTNNIVADYINIISHQGSPKFNKHLTEEDIDSIIKNAHPIPFGDILLEILKKLIDFCVNHKHRGSNTPTFNKLEINELLEQLNSKFIKIN